ncbi:MAG TPA: hypothetical protein VF174_00915 [Micromonosporaceae bacterium]
MAMSREPADDLRTVTRMQVVSEEVPASRTGYDAWSDEPDDPAFDEPIAVVDAPVPLREPLPSPKRRRR